MKKKSIIIAIISMIILLTIIALASYAFFGAGNLNLSNAVNLNTATERNNMVFDTIGGNFNLQVDAGDMTEYLSGNIAAENNTTLTVNFQANTSYDAVCTYDIVYEWLSTNKYQTHTSGITENEFTIQAELTPNAHASEGLNIIKNEQDLAGVVGTQNSAVVVSGAQIDSTGTTMNTAVWTLTTRFHNANGDQTSLAGKTYSGRFKVANVSCVGGVKSQTLTEYLVNSAPRSGTDAVSNSPWILTSDHTDEWRYAGKNPDNYIEFNGELWRIIGVMPNMTYCTGLYSNTSAVEYECNTTATGNLVKIIRNGSLGNFSWDYKQTGMGSSISDYGSNDWSDSQLMMMLNNGYYVSNGYDVNNNRLHYNGMTYVVDQYYVYYGINWVFSNLYDNSANYLDGNGTNVYIPSPATTTNEYTATSGTVPKKIESTALNQIATVKWYLYGFSGNDTPETWYNAERNINNTGSVYTNASLLENRAVYWYGKVGLMYPSDYGYATNGGSTYNRSACIGLGSFNWQSGSAKEDCPGNSYLWYNNITSVAPGGMYGTTQWTISPNSIYADRVNVLVNAGGVAHDEVNEENYVRPTLYLKADTMITGGTGTWNDPYTITSEKVKKYWFPTTLSEWNNNIEQYEPNYTYPAVGGPLQKSGSTTGHNVYIGQDNDKYYVCLKHQGHEVCLSQSFKQYGLPYGAGVNNTFTSGQQASAKQAIYQAFIDAGIDISINNCEANSNAVHCNVGSDSYCGINGKGEVLCNDESDGAGCVIDSDGYAACHS